MRPSGWFKWLESESDLDSTESRVLGQAYWGLLGGLSLLTVVSLLSDWGTVTILLAISLAVISVLFVLARRGYRNLTGPLTLFLLLSLAHSIIWLGGNIHSMSLVGYPIVVSLAGIYLRRLWFVLLTVASLLSLAVITYAQINGYMVTDPPGHTSWTEFAVVALVLLSLALAVQAQAEGLRKTVIQAGQDREARAIEETRFRCLIENISEVIVVLSVDGLVLYTSPPADGILGYSKDEWIGQSGFDLVHPDDLADAKAQFAKTVARPEAHHQIELRMRHKSGDWRSISFSSRNLIHEPSVGGVMVSYREITDRIEMTEALEDTARRLRLAMSATNMGLWVWDIESGRLQSQENLAETLGVEPETLDAMRGFGLIHEDDRKRARESVQRLLESEVRRRVELRLARPDGSTRWIAATARLVRDERGHPRQIVGVAQNITAYKDAEEKLRASEARFTKAFNANPHPMSLTRASDGHIFDVNESFLETFGYQREELIGHTAAEVGTWADFSERDRLIAKLRKEGSIRNEETELLASDGSIRTFLLSMEEFETAGEPCLLFASTDITERKRAEDLLRESERKLFEMFHSSPAPMTLSNLDDGRFVEANESALATLGWSRAELLGRPAHELGIWVDLSQREAVVADLTEGKARGPREVVLRRKDGEELTWLLSAERISIDQRDMVLWSAIDITERNRLAEQLQRSQKMEALGRLAGGVAHDFNNWLTPIVGYCDLLLHSDEDQGRLGQIAQIKKAGQRAAELASQLLRFSRGEMVQREPLNLNEVISSAELLLRGILGINVNFSVNLSEQLGAVKADRTQLEQVLLNLAVNARDAMPEGGNLRLETSPIFIREGHPLPGLELDEGSYAVISVSDSGCGMDSETMRQIFEPFFTTKGIGKGTGLGLSTAYGIVKQHDGDIIVYSEVDRGTTFKVYLPCAQGLALSAPSTRESVDLGGSETVLVVEDQREVREFTETALRSYGYQVVSVDGGERALEVLEKGNPEFSLMLADVVMPGLGGDELALRVRELRPEVRVMFVSGYTGQLVAGLSRLPTDASLVQKPFTAEELARAVRKCLDKEQ